MLDLAVEPVSRRRVFGTAILRAAEEVYRSHDVRIIDLNVFAGNIGARALYDRQGYRVTLVQMSKVI
jgi:ribosomal protein S18 acetylase RimI-like enzyme